MANQSSNDSAPKETSFNRKDELEGDKHTRKYNLVEEMNFLFVRVVKVIDFPNIPNLYIEIKLGNMKATTIYLESKLSWDQVFAFEKDKIHSDKLDVLVKDMTMPINMFIGRVQFIVGEIPTRVPPISSLAPQWYKLEDQNGANLARGAIMLSLWFGTQADEYFPQAWCSDTTRVSADAIAYTRSKVYMSPTLWYLRVNVIQAQDLLLIYPPESSEIFVQVDLLGTGLRSITSFSKNKSAKPFWNEDLMFVAQEPFNETLVLSIEQGTLANHTSLGTYRINLKDVPKRLDDSPAESLWYDLNRPGVINETAPYMNFASKLNARISLDGGYHVSDEPIEYSSDFRPSSKQLWKSSIGILEVGFLKATDLMPMKMGRRTDAYCVAKYGPKWVRTRTIVDSLSPNWNEQYVWEVYDPFTVITIAVCDNNQLDIGSRARGTRDTIMAKIRIRLSTLKRNKLYTHSYPLIGLHPFGVNKMGEIHLAVRFLTLESIFNMWKFYFTPLFPSIHLFLPLSPKQFDNLRNQAAHIIATSLSRAEPPLGREVVSNILDMRSDVWSMRKGIANYKRIMSLISDFVAFWKWLEDVKHWKNTAETVFFIIQCLIFIWFPEPILPLACFYFFMIGLNNYRKRPKNPCHIDATLSCVDAATPDVLQEEFDLIPTQFGGENLRRRYDQLRIIGRNVQVEANRIAVILDKLQSLSSWRDPRATLLFLLYCVFGLLVTFIVPSKLIISIWITYYLRHPRFRIHTIFSVDNFFRRMPSNEAFIL